MILKYLVEKSFRDKNTKIDILANSIIDVDLVRMKELNEKKIGRVIDVILNENIDNIDSNNAKQLAQIKNNETEIQDSETNNTETEKIDTSTSDSKTKYTLEQLEEMTVNELKDLAERIGCELKNAKKDEIIQEIIECQEK